MRELVLPAITTNLNGLDQTMNLFSHALAHREIYLTGEISDMAACSVITQLRYLNARSGTDEITLHIQSPGGSVSAGLAIYDVMRYELDCEIVTIAEGVAASMGALLLAAGTKGRRYAAPGSEILVHQPLGGVQGQVSDIALVAEHACFVKKKLAGILADATGRSLDTILQDTERDNWLSARQALAYGLVDHIGFPGKELEESGQEDEG